MGNYKVRLKRKLYDKLREIKSVKSSTAGNGDWSFTITHKDGSEIYYNYDDSRGNEWVDLVMAIGDVDGHYFQGVACIDSNDSSKLIYDATHDQWLHGWDGHEVLSVKIKDVLWNNIEPKKAQIEKDNSIKITKDDCHCYMSDEVFGIGYDNTGECWLIDEEIEQNIKSQIYDELVKASWLYGISKIRIHDLSLSLDSDEFVLDSVVFFEKLIYEIVIVDDENT